MLILDFYGTVKPESEAAGVFQIQAQWAGPGDAPYVATIVGFREYRLNLTTVVVDAAGALIGWPAVQVAHANPAIITGERARDFGAGKAEHFTSTESGTNGAQLGGGSKLTDGNPPVDEVWVWGQMPDGGRIRSQRVKVGLYSSDIVMSPVFQITKVGGAPVPAPTPTPTPLPNQPSDAKETIATGVSLLAQAEGLIRDGLFRLG